MSFPTVQLFGLNHSSKPGPDKLLAGHTQQGGTGKIDLVDQCFRAEGKVAHGGKIIEVQVPVLGLLQGQLGSSKFFICISSSIWCTCSS